MPCHGSEDGTSLIFDKGKQKIAAPRTDRVVVSAKYSTSTVVVEGKGMRQVRRFHCSSQARAIALGGVWRL